MVFKRDFIDDLQCRQDNWVDLVFTYEWDIFEIPNRRNCKSTMHFHRLLVTLSLTVVLKARANTDVPLLGPSAVNENKYIQTIQPASAQQKCDIPNEAKVGVCLAVGNCSAYLQARSVPNISAEKVNFLKKVQCSCKENDSDVLEPLVCCPANGQDYLYPSLKFSKFEYRRFQNVTAQFKRKKLKRRIQTVEPGESFNLRNECGKQVTNRIYGGEIAELDEFPWLALLVYSSSMI